MTEPEYPEHEKLRARQDEAQTIGEFLEWFESVGDGAVADTWLQGLTDIESVIAEYMDIDAKKLEAEKQAILESYEENS